jgi:hypothetical protein
LINYHPIQPKFSKNNLLNALKLAEYRQIGQIGAIDSVSLDGRTLLHCNMIAAAQ